MYFISHKLNKSQINYSTVEKECFAIMYSLERLHHWVSCSQIICKTDHMPLKYLLSSHFKNRKIASWQMNIAEYNIDIEYLPGKQNLIVDLMSRRPNNHEPDEGEVPQQVTSHKVNVIDSSKFDPIKYVNAELPLLDLDDKPKLIDLDTYDEQQKDDSIVQLIKNLDTGKLSKSLEKSLIVIDNVLYFVSDVDGSPRLRLYLPDHLTNVMIKGYHDFGHMGLDKTYDNLKVRYYFPNMYKRINEYVSKCVTCQERNMKPVKPPMGEMDIPAFAGCKWAADISGPYNETLSGNKYILTFICLYSSYIVCFAIPDKCSDTICSILMKRRHRSGSSSEDIPLLELQNRIKARNRQLKREYANRDVSSSTDSSSESDLKTRRSVHNDDSSLEGKDNQDQTPMHYDSETDEYYTDVGSTVPKQESMEVDQVNSVDNNQKEQVKQLLSAVIGLLK